MSIYTLPTPPRLSKAERSIRAQKLLQGSYHAIANTADFGEIVFGTDPGEWSIDEYELLAKPTFTRHNTQIKLRFFASRAFEYELQTPFYGDLVDGRALAVIPDNGEVLFEKIRGRIGQSSEWQYYWGPNKDAPPGDLAWEYYWLSVRWKPKVGDPTVHWETINEYGVAVAEDQFFVGYRYGIAPSPGATIKFNHHDLYATAFDAKRAALAELVRILSQPAQPLRSPSFPRRP